MSDTIELPFYAKFSLVLLSLISLFTILYYGQDIFIPILLSLLFAILLSPVCYFLKTKLRFPHVIAVIFSVTFFILIVFSILFFISWQVSDIVNDWDKIKINLTIHLNNLQDVVYHNFNLSKTEQKELINEAAQSSVQTGKNLLQSTLMTFTDTFFNLALIPIYTFLFLLYKTHFIKFLSKLYKTEHHERLQEILCQINISIHSYIVGLIIQMVAVTLLTTCGFMIIGLQYAIVLGIITGLLNLIPYIGILFAALLSIIATLTGSPDISQIIGVIIVIIIVQIIDNNLLVTLIVSSKVQINAFASIVGIIIGGTLFGFSGMFLAIPIIAIIKVIFDRIEALKPWGYLMSDDLPKTYTWRNIKLPLFDSETNIISEIDSPVFTETTTNSEEP